TKTLLRFRRSGVDVGDVKLRGCRRKFCCYVRRIVVWLPAHAVNNKHRERNLARLQLQPELLFERVRKRNAIGASGSKPVPGSHFESEVPRTLDGGQVRDGISLEIRTR